MIKKLYYILNYRDAGGRVRGVESLRSGENC